MRSRAGRHPRYKRAPQPVSAVAGPPEELDRERVVLRHAAAVAVHRAQVAAIPHGAGVAGLPVALKFSRERIWGLSNSGVRTENEAENNEPPSEHRIPLAAPSWVTPFLAHGGRRRGRLEPRRPTP